MSLVVGSCASHAAMVRAAPPVVPGTGPGTDGETQPPARPPAQPEPTPTPTPTACIPVHDGECVSTDDFESASEVLAEGYRSHRNFANQWGLSHARADHAYAHVNQLEGDAAPGAGVTIGFIDSGIDQNHPDFAGKTITEELIGSGTRNETGDRFSHGTAVASVAAAARTLGGNSAHGVAWGADIAMFAIPTGSASGPYDPITPAELGRAAGFWGDVFEYVIAWREGERRVDILNLSIAYDGIIDSYSEQELRDNFGAAIAAMAQAGVDDKAILVWAAGNAHGRRCNPAATAHCVDNEVNAVSAEVLSGLAARIGELQGHSIAVVALKRDGTIAEFSNRCGIAADHCIAAPGAHVRVAYFGPHPDTGVPVRGSTDVHGTSLAAPFVAGGLAVMKQLFRDQLANTELVARLLETANDEGIYADRAVYGRGALDLRAATWPVGVLDVPVGSRRVDGPGAALAATRLRAGAAFGDGMERSLSGREIAAFDTLGAPFWFDLGDLTATAAARGPIDEPLVDGGAYPAYRPSGSPVDSHWRVGFLEQPAGVSGGHLALAARAPGLTVTDRRVLTGTAFTTEGASGRAPVSGAAVWLQPADLPLGLRAGWLRERESVLGSTGDGAFGTLAGDTVFAGAATEAAVGAWLVRASAEIGTADAVPHGGIVSAISPLTTSAAAVSASRPFAGGGTLRVSIAQPLRVESGRGALAVPAGRTKAGEVVHRAFSADLTPSGRQIDVTAEWNQPLAIGELRVGTVVTHQPRHRASAAPEFLVRGGWRWRY